MEPKTNKPPICTIVAGPNGTGKTTFASIYLPDRKNFINADEIAKAFSEPTGRDIRAAKSFFGKVNEFTECRESFAIESTLSGRGYLKKISQLLSDGWRVELYYLWVPSIDVSINRVAERVRHGGHNIPAKIIARRYPRSVHNFIYYYAPLCNLTVCINNSTKKPNFIFIQRDGGAIEIIDKKSYHLLKQVAENDRERSKK
uniref:Predicted ABC-type ATPase n=1 Tax=Candidatus Kentrum sp. FW TaxID=2126338 RepID=A0A450U1U2_9GAMM|nr:MAG: Predicted ABC-type ATPase [Candidatus Kentron sp. FW]